MPYIIFIRDREKNATEYLIYDWWHFWHIRLFYFIFRLDFAINLR